MYVVAMVKALVGWRGVKALAVILVPGMGCIGAYLVKPVCDWYGMLNSSAPGAAAAVVPAAGLALLLTLLTVGGPAVEPAMAAIPCTTFGGKVPVMPVSVKRLE